MIHPYLQLITTSNTLQIAAKQEDYGQLNSDSIIIPVVDDKFHPTAIYWAPKFDKYCESFYFDRKKSVPNS